MSEMAPDLANILFFADSHAVEVMTFKVILGIPIDHADIRRFEDEIQKVEDMYPSITSPETIQFAIGRELNPPSPLVPLKELKLHLPNGKPEWAGSYGNNTIEVSCHKYEGWEKDWPKAKRRLDMLLGFINPDKTVLSVDYNVTNSFKARKNDAVLNPSNLFKKPNPFIAQQILELADPRWDFNQAWFHPTTAPQQTLVRINGHGGINGDWVVAAITSFHTCLHRRPVRTLLEFSDSLPGMDNIFDDFHNKSKKLLQDLLVPELVSRMGLDAV